jgi:hypothetical protein
MPYITEMRKIAELNLALLGFSNTCAANALALGGLTPAQLAEIAAMATNLNASINAYESAKAAEALALENRNIQLAASKATLSKWAKTFRANLAISDALLAQLNLPPHNPQATKTPPATPLDLTASADGQGLVSLRWKRNGNKSGTQFLIETQTTPGGEWTITGATTKVRFSFQAVPGNYVGFRVIAARDDEQSAPSVPVVLWLNGNENTSLSLAA